MLFSWKQGSRRGQGQTCEASEGLGLELACYMSSSVPPAKVSWTAKAKWWGCREGEELEPLMPSATGPHRTESGSIL